MCGIAGFVDSAFGELAHHVIEHMTSAIQYRGPNDSGCWIDTSEGIALGHRRLSILDVSSSGHQPMHSSNGRYVLIFNGEIYNFKTLTAELILRGHKFLGTSDTEVMLAAFQEWGVKESVEKFIGMFACALWDKKEKLLHLIRDRIGKKPLYYGWVGGSFLFGSELKALLAHPSGKPEVDRDAVAKMLRFGYVPAPWSIYKGIYKLLPGTILTFSPTDYRTQPANFSPFADESGKSFRPKRYWSLEQLQETAEANPFSGDEREATLELERLLKDAVAIRMIADVPLGAFLSGGIDSTAVVAMMQAHSSKPVLTFSIGYHEKEYDEALHARAVAKHLGTEHRDLYLSSKDALSVVPLLPQMYDEPFGDSSQIPTFLVSKLCSEHVTVSLSGDGGDELFCGYERYPWANKTWSWMRGLPPGSRRCLATLLDTFPSTFYDRIAKTFDSVSPKRLQLHNPGHKIQTLARILRFGSRKDLYEGVMSHWDEINKLVIGVSPAALQNKNGARHTSNFLDEMMFSDLNSYLPDDILVKVDRASMAVSLETRAPLLDHRIIEFAAKLPSKLKVEGAVTKKILRNLVHRHVPKTLVERPKMGFAVPIQHWLRNDLRDWAEDLIDLKKIKDQGLLNPDPIHRKWKEHLSGNHRWEHSLWNVFMFQAWLEGNKRQSNA